MNERRPPNPYRPDPPIFPPIIFDDDEDGPNPGRRRSAEYDRDAFQTPSADGPGRGGRSDDWADGDFDDFEGRGRRGGNRGGRGGRGPGAYPSDRGLIRILAVLGAATVIVLALVLPWSPLRLIGRTAATSGADGITATAQSSIPALPNGLVALSKFYDVRVPQNAKGPWAIEVTLDQATTDGNNLAFYSYDGTRWARVTNVVLGAGGTSVSGDVGSPPGSIAVLRRTGQAKTLALIVQAGDRLDPTAIDSTSIVAVMAASVGTDGALQATGGSLKAIAPGAGKAKVYFGVSSSGDGQGAVKNLGSAQSMSAQAEAIAKAAKGEGAAGVYLDYPSLPNGQKDAFTSFVKTLRTRLQSDQLGLVVGVPASAGATGAYDWSALVGAADGLWVRGPGDPVAYYDQMEQLLTAERTNKADLGKVSLLIGRRSIDRRGQQTSTISLRDALTAASAIDSTGGTPVTSGGSIALRAQQGTGLHWDAVARMVGFTYNAPNGGADSAHQVWIENRFSAAFRMDLASRFGLGGVAIEQAQQDDALPAIWDTAVLFAQYGSVRLERPYGPYLAPCWQATKGTVEGAARCWSTDTAAASVTWRAPQESGAYNIRLTVSDGATFIAQELALQVGGATPTPSATPTPTATARPGATPAATATTTPRPTTTPVATATPVKTPTPAGPPPIQTSTPVPTSTPPPASTPFPGGVPPGPAGQ